jgi:hypothetical protein
MRPSRCRPASSRGPTTHGQHEHAGSCGPSDSRELVYELDIVRRQRVTIEVEAHFDSVLYIRKDDCTDANAEVDCNDDAPDRTRSRIERVLEPGRYFVFVDGYGHEAGAFKLTVSETEVLSLVDMCAGAPRLVEGTTQTGTTSAMADDAEASCGGGAGGAEAVWRAELSDRSRVRVVEHSDDMAPVVHLRRACADEESEVACSESGAVAGDATATGVMDPGDYAVFADAREHGTAGRFTLLLQTAPLTGTGTNNDGCGDAAPLAGNGSGVVEGDTFTARDDVAGSCGGTGAPTSSIVSTCRISRASSRLWTARRRRTFWSPGATAGIAPPSLRAADRSTKWWHRGRCTSRWTARARTRSDASRCTGRCTIYPDRPWRVRTRPGSSQVARSSQPPWGLRTTLRRHASRAMGGAAVRIGCSSSWFRHPPRFASRRPPARSTPSSLFARRAPTSSGRLRWK